MEYDGKITSLNEKLNEIIKVLKPEEEKKED